MPAELAHLPVCRLGAGWDNVVYALGDELVCRYSLLAGPAERRMTAAHDRAILSLVSGRVGVETPTVQWFDDDRGVTVGRRVRGVPLADGPPCEPVQLGRTIGEFLTRLHSIDPRGHELVEPVWVASAGLDRAAKAIASHLDSFAASDRSMLQRFLDSTPPASVRSRLVHNDLGEEHLFVLSGDSSLHGVIDWSDAGTGDPARDFALLLLDLGDVATEAALASYGLDADGLEDRARWFGARAGVEGLAHRLDNSEDDVGDTLTRIRRVLEGRMP